jgi:transposase
MLFRRCQGLLRRAQRAERQLKLEHALRLRAEQRLRELEQARRPTASNSSLAPSANPPGEPCPVKKKPTGRRIGGQIGHPGKSRRLLPVEKMHRVVQHRPGVCEHCQTPLDGSVPTEVVGRHQVAELPAVAVELIEHQALACRCGKCHRLSRGKIPAQIAASVCGPRLTAAIGLLGAQVKGSRRAVAEVVEQVLGCPIALGSVARREAELSEALAEPHEQLVGAVAGAKVKYVDETGWKLKGKSRWLFVAATAKEAVFAVQRTRTHPALRQLLGGKVQGVFCSDRAGIYDLLPLGQRGLCWAHLRRDFVAMIERGGAGGALGEQMLAIAGEVFGLWRLFKGGRLRRRQLQKRVLALRRRMHGLLEEGAGCGQKKTAGLCRSLLKRESALWRFAWVAGLSPDNNLAERMLRPAVIWRKKSFGSHSEGGCRYVERMLSVIQTLKLRGQDVLGYVASAVAAYRRGEAAPAIVATRRSGAKRHRDGDAVRAALPRDLRKAA